MVDQNSYGPTQYCTNKECGKPLEKARSSMRAKMICRTCQRENAIKRYRLIKCGKIIPLKKKKK